MASLFHLVCFLLVLSVTKSLPVGDPFCRRDAEWRNRTCDYISVSLEDTEDLLNLVMKYKDVESRGVCSLKDPQSIITVKDFFQELKVYSVNLKSLATSMKTYMNSSKFDEDAAVVEVNQSAKTILEKMGVVQANIGQTLQLRKDEKTELECQTTASSVSLKDGSQICRETHYVTGELVALLKRWEGVCRECWSNKTLGEAKKGKKVKKGRTGKKNKDKSKGKSERKGKGKKRGKGKQNKKKGNKKSKSGASRKQ